MLFDELPDVFTRDMVKEKKVGQPGPAISNFLSRLKKDNLIELIGKNTYRKKTIKEKED